MVAALNGEQPSLVDLSDENFSEPEHWLKIEKELNILNIWLVPSKLMLYILDEDYQTAYELSMYHKPIMKVLPNTFYASIYTFHHLLSCLVLNKEFEQEDYEDFTKRAEACPANFEHALIFLRAEGFRVKGEIQEAFQEYELAIEVSKSSNYIHHVGMACERAASLSGELGLHIQRKAYLFMALELYEVWGANGKVKWMKATSYRHHVGF